MNNKYHTHEELLEILKEIDESDREVSDWEAKFIGSNLDARHFTMKQKKIISDMHDKYLVGSGNDYERV